MSALSQELLLELYRLLKSMRAGRITPAQFALAHTKLRQDGHIISRAKKRPMAKVKGAERAHNPDSSSGSLLKKPVEAVFRGCAALAEIRAVGRRKTEGGARHGLGHAERLFLASVLRGLPGGAEAIHAILGNCSDYDPAVTDYHIESLSYGPWRCATAQDYGVCGFAGQCPDIKKRGGKSPVAFAYRSRPTRPQRGVEWRPLEEAPAESTEELEMKVQRILKRAEQG